jgi:hypothetical protein
MSSRSHGSLWVRFHCSADRSTRTATFRRLGDEYQLFSVSREPVPPSGVAQSGGLPVDGAFGLSAEYRGCPGCGADSYVRCGSCGELGCWRSSRPYFSCGHCGIGGDVSGSITSISALDAG